VKRRSILGLIVGLLALAWFMPAGAQPYGSDLIVSHHDGRNLPGNAPQQDHDARGPSSRVDLGAHLGRGQPAPDVVALSLSGYTPGLNLPDGRVIPLWFDPFVALTARGPIPSFVTGNHGFLNARGEAVARLDLNRVAGTVQGVRRWAVAVVLDPRAPFGTAKISKPIRVMLE